jgi:threonine dehydrogenase-like Zn-dependent dehydrogenase
MVQQKTQALVWKGSKSVEIALVDKPVIKHERDAIVKVLSTTICGSDLHIYKGTMAGMESGDVLGHEAIGIIDEVGDALRERFPIGQRVVVSAVIGCGECDFCKEDKFSLCDRTNPSKEQATALGGGQKTAGIFGYTHLMGGYPGAQAQYLRVPFADVNLLQVSPELPDEKLLYLSDVYPTAWHGVELGKVDSNSEVAVWGLGPIGLTTMLWAKERGAKIVLGIDRVPSRLALAKSLGFQVINYEECNVGKFIEDLIPGGPNVCIDCVGFDYSKSWSHAIERRVKLETDAIDSVTEAIYACRKGGTVVLLGVYMGIANHFPIGALMNKGLCLTGGQVWVQKYWNQLYEKVRELDTSFLTTHTFPLKDAPRAYEMFNDKRDGVMKVILKPWE